MERDSRSHNLSEANRLAEAVSATRPKVCVVGLGGAGSNIVSWMKDKGVAGCKLIAANTDAVHLSVTRADNRILIGEKVTHGQGAGGHPEMGEKAAYESLEELRQAVAGSSILILCAGLGGGTGTGAISVLAKAIPGEDILKIGVVTLPFSFERYRYKKAKKGLDKLREYCDTVVAIDNTRLSSVAGDLPLEQGLGVASELVCQFVKGITETITTTSLINIDYADLKTIMERRGLAAIGVGESSGKRRVGKAAKIAIDNRLLDLRDVSKSYGILVHVTGGGDVTPEEVAAAGDEITKAISPEVKIVWGARVEDNMDGRVKVMAVLTGVEGRFLHHKRAA
ncbi:MAG TPA: cell division protein FtsZ [Nitrososphaerales archaeon]|nr:cell division protein FtsZ [Nitrososphaerales archaeon]